MLKAEVEHVYRIAHEVAQEEIKLALKGMAPAKAPTFDDSALKEEIAKLKGDVSSLQGEIKVLKAPVNKKK